MDKKNTKEIFQKAAHFTEVYEQNEEKIDLLKEIRRDFTIYIDDIKNILEKEVNDIEYEIKKKQDDYRKLKQEERLTPDKNEILNIREEGFSQKRTVTILSEYKSKVLEKIEKKLNKANTSKENRELKNVMGLIDKCLEEKPIMEQVGTIDMLKVMIETRYFESEIAGLEINNANLLENFNEITDGLTLKFLNKWTSEQLSKNGFNNFVDEFKDKILFLKAIKLKNGDLKEKEEQRKRVEGAKNIELSRTSEQSDVKFLGYMDNVEIFSEKENADFLNLNQVERKNIIIKKNKNTIENLRNEIKNNNESQKKVGKVKSDTRLGYDTEIIEKVAGICREKFKSSIKEKEVAVLLEDIFNEKKRLEEIEKMVSMDEINSLKIDIKKEKKQLEEVYIKLQESMDKSVGGRIRKFYEMLKEAVKKIFTRKLSERLFSDGYNEILRQKVFNIHCNLNIVNNLINVNEKTNNKVLKILGIDKHSMENQKEYEFDGIISQSNIIKSAVMGQDEINDEKVDKNTQRIEYQNKSLGLVKSVKDMKVKDIHKLIDENEEFENVALINVVKNLLDKGENKLIDRMLNKYGEQLNLTDYASILGMDIKEAKKEGIDRLRDQIKIRTLENRVDKERFDIQEPKLNNSKLEKMGEQDKKIEKGRQK